jgi:hypothetical protein
MSIDLAKPIKIQVLANLQALVTAGKLSSFISLDQNPDPLSIQPTGGYPFAIVGMPRIASDFEDQANNLRTYRFDVLFVLDPSALANPDTDVEDLIDAALNQFDSNFTLAGAANAAILPATVQGQPVSTGQKNLLVFVITLECRVVYQVGT